MLVYLRSRASGELSVKAAVRPNREKGEKTDGAGRDVCSAAEVNKIEAAL